MLNYEFCYNMFEFLKHFHVNILFNGLKFIQNKGTCHGPKQLTKKK